MTHSFAVLIDGHTIVGSDEADRGQIAGSLRSLAAFVQSLGVEQGIEQFRRTAACQRQLFRAPSDGDAMETITESMEVQR